MDLEALRAVWEQESERTRAFVEELHGADAGRGYALAMPDGSERTLRLGDMMLQVATHGTEQRSLVASMLTAHGRSPGGLDLLYVLWRPEDA